MSLRHAPLRPRSPLALLVAAMALGAGCGKHPTAESPAPMRPGGDVVVAPPPADAAVGPGTTHAAPVPPGLPGDKAASPAGDAEAPGDPTAPGASSAILEADIRALVDGWLAAQNSGRFADYERLYASRFRGIKRAGPQARTFDRAGWLRDRQTMFRRAMKVAAADLVIAPSTGAAVATFTQTWESGDFRDVGPKQLVIVPEGGGLRIAREEMLASEVVGAEPVKRLDPSDFSFVALESSAGTGTSAQAATPFVLLAPGTGELTSEGPLTLHAAADYASASRAIPEAAVSAAWRSWIGRKVILAGPSGARCEGRVVSLVHLARSRPHFNAVQAWKGLGEDPSAEPLPMPRDAVVEEVWDLGASGLFLAGRVEVREGADCAGVTWARAADRPAVTTAAPEALDPELEAVARAALRKLKAWREIQKAYREEAEPPHLPHWDGHGGEQPRGVTFRTADGQRLLWMRARVGEGCGDFGRDLWALWRVEGAGKGANLQLLSADLEQGPAVVPGAAADLDGDGRPELIGPDALIQPAGATWRPGSEATAPDLDCPC